MIFANAYCVDTIIILKWNGYDEWNEPLSGNIIEVKGYVEYKTRLVRDIKGEERASSVMVYLPKKIDKTVGRPLSHEDRLIVGEESIERSIISIQQPKAFSRPHYEVYLA
jgi:hypothetical protein